MWEKQTAPPTNWPHQRHWTSNPSRKHTSICRRWCWCGEQNRTEQTKQTKLGAEKKKLYYGWFRESVWTHENKYLYERARADRWVLNADYVCARPSNSKINKWRSCVRLYACMRASERERGTEKTQWNDQTTNVCVIVVLSGRKNITKHRCECASIDGYHIRPMLDRTIITFCYYWFSVTKFRFLFVMLRPIIVCIVCCGRTMALIYLGKTKKRRKK